LLGLIPSSKSATSDESEINFTEVVTLLDSFTNGAKLDDYASTYDECRQAIEDNVNNFANLGTYWQDGPMFWDALDNFTWTLGNSSTLIKNCYLIEFEIETYFPAYISSFGSTTQYFFAFLSNIGTSIYDYYKLIENL